ncbi:MAG: Sjogren's syndrome/scleroderma autoantigen 1 family protein [Candidatus Lokiarchaeota archaeon]
MSENTKKMADLLRKGNKMLNRSCPQCNNPLFENKNGKIFCPSCNREVVIVESQDEYQKIKESKSSIKNSNINDDIDSQSIFRNIRLILLKKIELLANDLKDEDQLENIERYVNLIDKLNELLKKLGN